jgi:hypothetical protein
VANSVAGRKHPFDILDAGNVCVLIAFAMSTIWNSASPSPVSSVIHTLRQRIMLHSYRIMTCVDISRPLPVSHMNIGNRNKLRSNWRCRMCTISFDVP